MPEIDDDKHDTDKHDTDSFYWSETDSYSILSSDFELEIINSNQNNKNVNNQYETSDVGSDYDSLIDNYIII